MGSNIDLIDSLENELVELGCTTERVIEEPTTNKTFQNCFVNSSSLSDKSLNNILAMCANATSYTGIKKLNYIGLTSEQATKCTTLSNYQTFLDAGWTTGY